MKQIIKLVIIFTFALFSWFLLVDKGNTQTKIETAGQKFKSIRVLNDMPADQMGKVMNMMSASLGVDCKFCHASNDGEYEKEGFEHKDIARKMLAMTYELNKSYFDSKPEITCATCHQGKPVPQSAIPLIPSVRESRRAQNKKMPPVEEILTKYETALGGKANLAKITSRHIKAQRIEPDEKTFEEEEIWQKGSKLLIKTVYPSKEYGDYVIEEIFDGTRAFKTGNGSEIELKADEIEQIRREAEIFVNPRLKSVYNKLAVLSIEKIDGREVYLVKAETAGNLIEKLYFDVRTSLLARRTASTPTIIGDFVFQVDYRTYKNFGGVFLPTEIKFAVPHISWTRRILEVKNNVKIEDAAFIK